MDARPFDILGISQLEEDVYRWLLAHPGATVQEVAYALPLSPSKTQRLLDVIAGKGLATHSPERPRRYFPASPSIAIEALVRRRREDLERAQMLIPELQQRVARSPGVHEQMVELITSAEGGRQALEQMQSSAEHEMVTLIRSPLLISRLDRPVDQEQRTQRKAQSRGVRFRSIVDAEFLAVPGFIDWLRADMEAGEEVRVFPHLPFKLAMTDRRIALIPLDLEQASSPVLLVRSSALLDALYALFELFWERAAPVSFTRSGALETGAPAELLSREVEEVMSLLAIGLNDKVIAHELKMSTRSLERRVAELMQSLGARTRFQAGWIAALRQSADSDSPTNV